MAHKRAQMRGTGGQHDRMVISYSTNQPTPTHSPSSLPMPRRSTTTRPRQRPRHVRVLRVHTRTAPAGPCPRHPPKIHSLSHPPLPAPAAGPSGRLRPPSRACCGGRAAGTAPRPAPPRRRTALKGARPPPAPVRWAAGCCCRHYCGARQWWGPGRSAEGARGPGPWAGCCCCRAAAAASEQRAAAPRPRWRRRARGAEHKRALLVSTRCPAEVGTRPAAWAALWRPAGARRACSSPPHARRGEEEDAESREERGLGGDGGERSAPKFGSLKATKAGQVAGGERGVGGVCVL